jgi:hypothetical protein
MSVIGEEWTLWPYTCIPYVCAFGFKICTNLPNGQASLSVCNNSQDAKRTNLPVGSYIKIIIIIIIIYGFILAFTRGYGTTIRHNTQITHHAQKSAAHKTTETKDALQTMNTMQIQLIN